MIRDRSRTTQVSLSSQFWIPSLRSMCSSGWEKTPSMVTAETWISAKKNSELSSHQMPQLWSCGVTGWPRKARWAPIKWLCSPEAILEVLQRSRRLLDSGELPVVVHFTSLAFLVYKFSFSTWRRDALKIASAPGPFGDRRDTPRWRWRLMAGTAACCTQFCRCCPFLSLYSHSQRS